MLFIRNDFFVLIYNLECGNIVKSVEATLWSLMYVRMSDIRGNAIFSAPYWDMSTKGKI